jgi:hypothetical protein
MRARGKIVRPVDTPRLTAATTGVSRKFRAQSGRGARPPRTAAESRAEAFVLLRR